MILLLPCAKSDILTLKQHAPKKLRIVFAPVADSLDTIEVKSI